MKQPLGCCLCHSGNMWKCAVLGHQIEFRADGQVMRWSCRRCGGAAGSKTYDTARDAARYAEAFDQRDADAIGRRAPLLGMFPLRIWRMLRGRR